MEGILPGCAIFNMLLFSTNRRTAARPAIRKEKEAAPLALFPAMALLLVLVVSAAEAQQQTQPPATQTATTSPSNPDPPTSTTSDAAADPTPADAGTETMLPHFKNSRFWLSGQANFIFQTHPDFHADYSGPHSLSPDYEKGTSRVLTLYTGVRLNNSTELLVDLEEAGGAALSLGFGLAGNANLDIVRNPLLSKEVYLGRGMIHKVFALSKDKVENERNAFSLFDE